MNYRRNKLRFLDLFLRPDDEYVYSSQSLFIAIRLLNHKYKKGEYVFFFMMAVKVLTVTRYV